MLLDQCKILPNFSDKAFFSIANPVELTKIEAMERFLNWPSLSALEWLATSTRVLWLTALLIVAGMADRLSVWVILIILLWIAFSITGPLASGQKWRI